jgi:cell division protein FtsW (lipid II flippase)
MTLKQLLTEESWNSRLVYLFTNATVCISVLALVVATIWKGQPENHLVLDAFIFMVGTLLSGGVASGASRWLTTKGRSAPPAPEVERTVTMTSVESTTPKKKKSS